MYRIRARSLCTRRNTQALVIVARARDSRKTLGSLMSGWRVETFRKRQRLKGRCGDYRPHSDVATRKRVQVPGTQDREIRRRVSTQILVFFIFILFFFRVLLRVFSRPFTGVSLADTRPSTPTVCAVAATGYYIRRYGHKNCETRTKRAGTSDAGQDATTTRQKAICKNLAQSRSCPVRTAVASCSMPAFRFPSPASGSQYRPPPI